MAYLKRWRLYNAEVKAMAESSSSGDHEDPIVEEAANHSGGDVAQRRPFDAYSCQESDYGFSEGVVSSDSDEGTGKASLPTPPMKLVRSETKSPEQVHYGSQSYCSELPSWSSYDHDHDRRWNTSTPMNRKRSRLLSASPSQMSRSRRNDDCDRDQSYRRRVHSPELHKRYKRVPAYPSPQPSKSSRHCTPRRSRSRSTSSHHTGTYTFWKCNHVNACNTCASSVIGEHRIHRKSCDNRRSLECSSAEEQ
ncbi:hypothetical protein LSAT2_003734 [Lamellibrachia satsuma]|nr:hypothetical protein LSAT2_003734 [Lamellibrachia satsuma]